METTVEKITPTVATKYLEMNTINRPIRQSHVDFLAREIKENRWMLNGASIVFNGGTLVDGQHRLWAVLSADKPIQTVVVRGVDEESFSTIDTGRLRTAGDVLAIAGNENATTLAAAARFVMDYHSGNLFSRERISNMQVVEFIEKNPELKESTKFVIGAKGTRIVSVSIAAGLHFLMAKKDRELANEYISGIFKGFSLEGGETFNAVRERIIASIASSSKVHARVCAVFLIKAWNAKRAGTRMKIFKFIDGEQVPRIK